jgi:hypothetical protein
MKTSGPARPATTTRLQHTIACHARMIHQLDIPFEAVQCSTQVKADAPMVSGDLVSGKDAGLRHGNAMIRHWAAPESPTTPNKCATQTAHSRPACCQEHAHTAKTCNRSNTQVTGNDRPQEEDTTRKGKHLLHPDRLTSYPSLLAKCWWRCDRTPQLPLTCPAQHHNRLSSGVLQLNNVGHAESCNQTCMTLHMSFAHAS